MRAFFCGAAGLAILMVMAGPGSGSPAETGPGQVVPQVEQEDPASGATRVYRLVDEGGEVTYTDRPAAAAQAIDVPTTNTMPAPAPTAAAEAAVEADAGYSVHITAPADQTIIPRGPGSFSVAAEVSPGLGPGRQLQLLVDGVAEGEPRSQPSWNLSNVFRGSHRLQVQVLDRDGAELARSAAVTVYVFRPSSRYRDP